MTDKMREAFEKWYMTNTFAHVDHLSVFYNDLNCYPTPIANHCWKAWQAAQSVPMVGEVVAWDNFPGYLIDHQEGSIVTEENLQFWLSAFIKNTDYNKPTTSISAAELERLRKCEDALKQMLWIVHDSSGVAGYHLNGDIAEWESFPEYHAALAAIAAEGEK